MASTPMTLDYANRLASRWHAAWKSHDALQILALYSDDVHFVSPSVALINQDPRATIRGKAALAAYVERVLARFQRLDFEPIASLFGIDSVAMHYRGVGGHLVVEVVTPCPGTGEIVSSAAFYDFDLVALSATPRGR